MSRFFYYDSRFHASPDYPKSHPTIFEFDDTVRAKGVAYATLAFLFDHSRGLGNISPDAQTAAYLFERNGVPLVAVFSLDDQPRTLTLPLDPSQFRAYDLMGNALEQPASVVSYCGEPVYLEGQGGVSIAAFRTAVERGRIEARRDADAPNVSISECPRGSVASTHFRVRWIAVDKVSVACDNTSADAVLYSYRLVGHETAWSDWNPGTWTCYQNLRGGQYRFEVRAKDQGGNTSSVVGRDFSVAPTSTQAKSD
jgi:hypothetical protein